MNPLLAKSNEIVTVNVEYTANGQRVVKVFSGKNAIAASRSFYRIKLKQGAEPKVIGAKRFGEK